VGEGSLLVFHFPSSDSRYGGSPRCSPGSAVPRNLSKSHSASSLPTLASEKVPCQSLSGRVSSRTPEPLEGKGSARQEMLHVQVRAGPSAQLPIFLFPYGQAALIAYRIAPGGHNGLTVPSRVIPDGSFIPDTKRNRSDISRWFEPPANTTRNSLSA